ncbi:thioredoxin-related transmembrane protein 2 [Citrus sinensis]|uniref:Thioredoxin-related transmembrane protein 2 n=1 Tax=Citrus sinensis TaxID=2711 RepID=A0ACB8NNH7_CITSI|nr:thioredoxin-related transmembrane protein 2 [Citrus sinensis]
MLVAKGIINEQFGPLNVLTNNDRSNCVLQPAGRQASVASPCPLAFLLFLFAKEEETCYSGCQLSNQFSFVAKEVAYFLQFACSCKISAAAVLSPHIIHHLFYREIQAVLALSLLAAIKITREETWEEFIDNMLFYAKVITSESFFASSGSYCINNGLPFGSLVSGGFFRLNFVPSVHPPVYVQAESFPSSQLRIYSNKNVSFGIVDLGLFPNAAEKFGISLGGSMGQLPTYILFENNAEINRFPAFGFEEKFSHPHITKKLIAHHFQLDRLRIESVHGD